MPTRAPEYHIHRLERGYTLLELLVVLLILTAALSLSAPIFANSNSSLQSRMISREIALQLRQTRSAAITDNEARYWAASHLDDTLQQHAPDRHGMAFNFFSNSGAPTGHDALVFYPDGSANGGSIDVIAPGRAWKVTIGLSGRITINETRPEEN